MTAAPISRRQRLATAPPVKVFIVSVCSGEYFLWHMPGRPARGYVVKGHVARSVRAFFA
jgi:hypothetical protein